MKKIALIILAFTLNLSAYTYSSSTEDMVHLTFQQLDKFINKLNDQAIENYNNMKENVIANLLDNFELKQETLEENERLEKLQDIDKMEFLFELKKNKALNGVVIDSILNKE